VTVTLVLTDQAFDAESELRVFSMAHPDAGAVASFVGRCRARSGDTAVLALELDVYPGFTHSVISEKLRTLGSTSGVDGILVVHRHGRIDVGEAIVLVAVAGPHRRAAITVMDRAMDWLKVEAPFWKKEHRTDGAHWIEPTDRDRTDAARWHETQPPVDPERIIP
jgi:molybdopterin synthase catalytic subunit